MESLKNIAKRYLTVDKLSVIPVGKNKIPLIAWKEYQTRFATEAEIDEWWEKYPEAQIGICTGKLSNLTVVDIEKGGDPAFLPQNTLIVKTGGDGYHYYYKFQDGMQNKARIMPLIDIRGEGGYVVAPGSTSEKGSYEVLQKMIPASFPTEMFKSINPTVGPFRTVTNEGVSIPEEIVSDSFFLLSSYPGYGKGQRNDEMTRFIGKVLKRINSVHWNTHAFDIVARANSKNTPPLDVSELLASFNSIKSRETSNIPIHTPLGATEAQVAPVLLVSDGSDDSKHIATVAGEQKINQEDIYPLEMPVFDDVILGGVSPGDLVVIAGKTGEGKTSLAQDWTLSFIRGPKKAPVLWFSYEVLPTHLWKKFQTMGMTEEDIAVIPAKHSSGNVAWVELKVKEAKEKFDVKVVVIDHLGFLLPKGMGMLGKNMSSNYSTFLTQITRDLKTIALQEEVIIILPVHMRKTDKVDMDAIKDSVGISQESDLVFLISRERSRDTKTYYTDFTQITLSKNRKTGQTISAWFTMIKERFAYSGRNEEEKKHNDNFEKFGEVDNSITSIADDEF